MLQSLKNILSYALDIVYVRAQLFSLEAEEHTRTLVRAIFMAIACLSFAALTLLAMLALTLLLFWDHRLWVLLGFSTGTLALTALCALKLCQTLRSRHNHFFPETLRALNQDLAYLRPRDSSSETHTPKA